MFSIDVDVDTFTEMRKLKDDKGRFLVTPSFCGDQFCPQKRPNDYWCHEGHDPADGGTFLGKTPIRIVHVSFASCRG